MVDGGRLSAPLLVQGRTNWAWVNLEVHESARLGLLGLLYAFSQSPMRLFVLVANVLVMCSCSKGIAAELPRQTCARIEAKDVGTLPLVVELGGKKIHVTEWTQADAESTSVVGFALSTSEVSYTVQAGDRTFHGSSSRWLHPLGVWGPYVHGIDSMTLCAQPTAG